jgi:hypothetical protein
MIHGSNSIPIQTQTILEHLRGGPITPLDALHRYHCFRLAARIHDLRKGGHQIVTNIVHDDHTGKHYAEYHLLAQARQA